MRPLLEQLREAWSVAKATARLAIGVPDYDAYVAHMREHHADTQPMSRDTFMVERMQARYAQGRSRCC